MDGDVNFLEGNAGPCSLYQYFYLEGITPVVEFQPVKENYRICPKTALRILQYTLSPL